MRDGDFEILPAGEMRAKYGLCAENRPIIKLDASKVPATLRHLVSLAEQFGIPDDLIRADFVSKTPSEEIETMRRSVRAYEDELEAWLAGPEADGPEFSDEYVAFSCLIMAADGA